jgi:hypothetical protein
MDFYFNIKRSLLANHTGILNGLEPIFKIQTIQNLKLLDFTSGIWVPTAYWM